MKYKHYAPDASLIIVEGENHQKVSLKIKSLGENYYKKGLSVALLVTEDLKGYFEFDHNFSYVFSLGPLEDLSIPAKNLYHFLRELDQRGVDIIIAQGFEEKGIGLALANRLKKAAADKVIKV